MPFAETLLATGLGALIAAVLAWAFAIDLRRRESRDAGRARLDAAVSDVVRLLGEYGGTAQAFAFSSALNNPAVPAPSPHLARQQLLSATLVARMAAGENEAPLLAVYELLTGIDDRTPMTTAVHYESVAHVLVRWRQDEISTSEAAASITAGPSTPRRAS